MSLSISLIRTFVILFINLHFHAESNEILSTESKYLCATSYIEQNRTLEIVNCIYDPLGEHPIRLNYECKVIQHKDSEAIETKLIINEKIEINYATFKWAIEKEEHHGKKLNKSRYAYNEAELKNLKNVTLSETEAGLEATLVLVNIEKDVPYEISVFVPEFNKKYSAEPEEIHCTIEITEEEEKNNVFMSLIVIGILLIMFVTIMIVFWKCPPNEFHSVDEMLEKLPTSHVKALKKLVLEREGEEDDNESVKTENSKENLPYRYRKRKDVIKQRGKVRVNTNVTEIDNPAYVDDSEAEKSEKSELEDVETRLRFEKLKLRRMSRVSVGQISRSSSVPRASIENLEPAVGRKGGVRFADDTDDAVPMSEIDNLKVKLFNESKRRASVKIFKKSYNLYVSSDSDSS